MMSRLRSARLILGGAGRADGKEREEKKYAVDQLQFSTEYSMIVKRGDRKPCFEWAKFYFTSAFRTPAAMSQLTEICGNGAGRETFGKFLARFKDKPKSERPTALWAVEEETKEGWKLRPVNVESIDQLRPTRLLSDLWKTTFDTWFSAEFNGANFDTLQPAPVLAASTPYRELITRHHKDWLLTFSEFLSALGDLDSGPALIVDPDEEPFLWKEHVLVPNSWKLPAKLWNEVIFAPRTVRPETFEEHHHAISIPDLYTSRNDLTLADYFRLIQRVEPASYRVVEQRTVDQEKKAVPGGTWLKYHQDPSFIWFTGDVRTLREWEVELIYGFPLVHTLLRNEWVASGGGQGAKYDLLTKPVGLDTYVAQWQRLDGEGKIYHHPVHFQWPALPWPEGGGVFLDPVSDTENLDDRCINDRDYISQEDWKTEKTDEHRIDTLLVLKADAKADDFPNKGHCWKHEDLVKALDTAEPTFGWINDGYAPTHRYYHIPYPDVWIDRPSYLRYTRSALLPVYCWLLVPGQKNVALGTRDGMLGIVSSMHGDKRTIYSMYPHRHSFEYQPWFPSYVEMLSDLLSDLDELPVDDDGRVIPLFRGIFLSIWQELLISRKKPDLPIDDVGNAAIAKKLAVILSNRSNRYTFDLIDLVWLAMDHAVNFRIFRDWLKDATKRKSEDDKDNDDGAILNGLWSKTKQLSLQLDPSRLLVEEIKRIYSGNYCEDPYTEWIPAVERDLGVRTRIVLAERREGGAKGEVPTLNWRAGQCLA